MSNSIKNIIGGVIFTFFGFIFVVDLIYTPDRDIKKNNEPEPNVRLVNRSQNAFIKDHGKFAKTFDELELGSLIGASNTTTQYFWYKLDIRSKDLAIIGAKPLDREMYGFNGAVLRSKNGKGVISIASIVCRSQSPGSDGTNPDRAPITDATTGKLRCAAGWDDFGND